MGIASLITICTVVPTPPQKWLSYCRNLMCPTAYCTGLISRVCWTLMVRPFVLQNHSPVSTISSFCISQETDTNFWYWRSSSRQLTYQPVFGIVMTSFTNWTFPIKTRKKPPLTLSLRKGQKLWRIISRCAEPNLLLQTLGLYLSTWILQHAIFQLICLLTWHLFQTSFHKNSINSTNLHQN